MVPDVEPPTGCVVPEELSLGAAPPMISAGLVLPGYFAIACAGVAPLITAIVRSI